LEEKTDMAINKPEPAHFLPKAQQVEFKDLWKHEFTDWLQAYGFGKVYSKYSFTVGNCKVAVEYEQYDPKRAIKVMGVEDAVRLVHSQRYALPEKLFFYLIASEKPACQAFIRSGKINPNMLEPSVVISGKQNNYPKGIPMTVPKTTLTVRGGWGTSSPRGVHDQIYDLQKGDRAAEQARMKAMICHEIGHLLHYFSDPNTYLKLKQDSKENFSVPEKECCDLSHYMVSRHNFLELVAEMFTGRLFGLSYLASTEDLYMRVKGPAPG